MWSEDDVPSLEGDVDDSSDEILDVEAVELEDST